MWKKIFVIFLLAAVQAADKKKFKVTLEKIDVEADPAYVSITSAIRTENGGTVADISGQVLQDINSGIFVNISVLTEINPGEFKPLLHMDNIDFCAFNRNATMAPLLHMFLNHMNSFGSIPLKCPIKKGDFHLKGYNIAHEHMPSVTPEGRYLVDVKADLKNDDESKEIYHNKWVALIEKE